MSHSAPTRVKAPTLPYVGSQKANLQKTFGSTNLSKPTRRRFGEEQPKVSQAPDLETQMAHALAFGHNFGKTVNMAASVQRQPKPDEEMQPKLHLPLYRQVMGETEEDEEETARPKIQPQLEEDDETVQPKINAAKLQRRQDEEDELQRQEDVSEKDEALRPQLVQSKLTIGQPGDKYEQEADRTAAQVMRMPDPVGMREQGSRGSGGQGRAMPRQQPRISPLLQREAIPEEEEELQAKPQL
ncbi:MAG: hypothetical protein F6K19_08450 [Cyanothece sp. SIO1E1]|nr:hypothetical protein [Cyanothece sp. SIO1E1]